MVVADVRPGGGHYEGRIGRRSLAADERLSLRPRTSSPLFPYSPTADAPQTASIWTDIDAPGAADAFEMFAQELETGTVFLNRCDYLDPALAWTGVKDSGRGVSLSKFGESRSVEVHGWWLICGAGYDQLTRPKSIHMKVKTT